jgi:hypothetical protein
MMRLLSIRDSHIVLMLMRCSTSMHRVSHHPAIPHKIGSTTILLARILLIQLQNRYLKCGISSWLMNKRSFLNKLTSSQLGISICQWAWQPVIIWPIRKLQPLLGIWLQLTNQSRNVNPSLKKKIEDNKLKILNN